MKSIQPTNSSSASQVSPRIASGPARGGNPEERLNKDLSKLFSKENVSSDEQQAIKAEFSDALKSLSSSGTQVSPTQVKEVLSGVLTAHGLDGASFVNGLGTPPSGSAPEQQGDQNSDKRPPGGRPPPSSKNVTSASNQKGYLQELIKLLSESKLESAGMSTSKSSQNVPPTSYTNRSSGNLDIEA